jgi:hypothetical protein
MLGRCWVRGGDPVARESRPSAIIRMNETCSADTLAHVAHMLDDVAASPRALRLLPLDLDTHL